MKLSDVNYVPTEAEAREAVQRWKDAFPEHVKRWEGLSTQTSEEYRREYFDEFPAPLPVVDRPDSVTHFICLSGAMKLSAPKTTHHINQHGNCVYCQKSQHALRKEIGLDGPR